MDSVGPPDLIGVVEAAYNLDADGDQWLAGVSRAINAVIDAGAAISHDQWARAGAHIRSALEIRLKLAKSSSTARAYTLATAALDSAQQTADADAARHALRAAVLRMRRAYRGELAEAKQVLPSRRTLMQARWVLVDEFDADGDRYIVAKVRGMGSVGFQSLTPRELQVAACISRGLSNKEIAFELGLSHSTVRVLFARASTKLGATSRAELVTKYRADALEL